MPVRVLEDAELELHDAMQFYEDRRDGLGSDFLMRVTETLEAIRNTPRRFPKYEAKKLSRTFRRAIVSGFPYIVVYEIRPTETLVVSVAHTSRDPGYWSERE